MRSRTPPLSKIPPPNCLTPPTKLKGKKEEKNGANPTRNNNKHPNHDDRPSVKKEDPQNPPITTSNDDGNVVEYVDVVRPPLPPTLIHEIAGRTQTLPWTPQPKEQRAIHLYTGQSDSNSESSSAPSHHQTVKPTPRDNQHDGIDHRVHHRAKPIKTTRRDTTTLATSLDEQPNTKEPWKLPLLRKNQIDYNTQAPASAVDPPIRPHTSTTITGQVTLRKPHPGADTTSREKASTVPMTKYSTKTI